MRNLTLVTVFDESPIAMKVKINEEKRSVIPQTFLFGQDYISHRTPELEGEHKVGDLLFFVLVV